MEKFDRDLRSLQQARDLARAGAQAAKEFSTYSEEQVDLILKNMVRVAEANKVMLAEMAHKETGYGNVYDKTFKNHLASTLLYNEIKDQKTQGIIDEDPVKKTVTVAAPVGLIMGITPSTNPTSTIIAKSMLAMKTRNAIVFAPHPKAINCCVKAAELMAIAAEEAGAPKGAIGCVSIPSMEASNWLMHCDEVKLILATGGPGMVKAAYSSGKPALGVGSGNSPAYIEKSANVEKAVQDIFISKTFDQGLICSSEQSIVVEEANHDAVVAELKKQGGYFLSPEEVKKVCNVIFKPGTHTMSGKFVGHKAEQIAEAAGITIPAGTKLLIGPQNGVGPDWPLSYEKLTQVIAFYTVADWKEAHDLSYRLLQHGLGHTFNIHTESKDMAMKFMDLPASRFILNGYGAQGGVGAATGTPISFTLGCGPVGGSAVSENVSAQNLVVKKILQGKTLDLTDIKKADPSFDYEKPAEAAPAAGATSPDAFANAFASDKNVTTGQCCTTPAGGDTGVTQEQLADIVNMMMKSLKGEN
jgi:acetaldehyde dehydrogenase (acetylating)